MPAEPGACLCPECLRTKLHAAEASASAAGRDDQIGEGVLHRELGIESSRVRVADNFDAPLPATLRAGFLGKEKKKGRHR
jgi:hypothetical protein